MHHHHDVRSCGKPSGNRRLRGVVEGGVSEEFAGGAFAGVQIVDNRIELANRIIRIAIKLIIHQQLADAALPAGDIGHQGLELGNRGVQTIVKTGIVNHLPDGSLAAFHESQYPVDTFLQQLED